MVLQKEGLALANALADNLTDSITCTKWPDAFPLSNYVVDSLLAQLHDNVLQHLSYHQMIQPNIRDKDYSIARDNLLYEAGLSTGIYGKNRCFLILAKDLKISICLVT